MHCQPRPPSHKPSPEAGQSSLEAQLDRLKGQQVYGRTHTHLCTLACMHTHTHTTTNSHCPGPHRPPGYGLQTSPMLALGLCPGASSLLQFLMRNCQRAPLLQRGPRSRARSTGGLGDLRTRSAAPLRGLTAHVPVDAAGPGGHRSPAAGDQRRQGSGLTMRVAAAGPPHGSGVGLAHFCCSLLASACVWRTKPGPTTQSTVGPLQEVHPAPARDPPTWLPPEVPTGSRRPRLTASTRATAGQGLGPSSPEPSDPRPSGKHNPPTCQSHGPSQSFPPTPPNASGTTNHKQG